MATMLLLLVCAEPASAWWILFADEKGGYWVDARSGETKYDPELARKKKEPDPVDDGLSQLALPEPPRRRFRDASVTKAKGVTVRMIKNRLRLEAGGKKEWLTRPMLGGRPMLRPDGKVLGYLRWDGESRRGNKAIVVDLVLLDLDSRKETVLVEKAVVDSFAWSPDGKRIVVGQVGTATLFDAKTRKAEMRWKLTDIHEGFWNHAPTHFVFHPKGDRIATRCVFVGGREAGTKVFGDHKLVLLSGKKSGLIDLPETTNEGPIRGKLEDRGS